MRGTTIQVQSALGDFDCYLATPDKPGPGIVVMSTIFGVDKDLINTCDRLAAQGFLVMAPDLFWRCADKGPLTRSEADIKRAERRSQPRRHLLETNIKDLEATLALLRTLGKYGGRSAVIGLCYGGPFAIIGPSRFRCDAGISFHGSFLQDYIDELKELRCPLSLHWGDEDFAAPPEVLAEIKAACADNPAAEIYVYPGIKHGYMSPSQTKSHVPEIADLTWQRAMKVLDALKTAGPAETAPAMRAGMRPL